MTDDEQETTDTEEEKTPPMKLPNILDRKEANIAIDFDLTQVKMNVLTSHGGLAEASDITKELLDKVGDSQSRMKKECVGMMQEELEAEKFGVRDVE